MVEAQQCTGTDSAPNKSHWMVALVEAPQQGHCMSYGGVKVGRRRNRDNGSKFQQGGGEWRRGSATKGTAENREVKEKETMPTLDIRSDCVRQIQVWL